MVAINPTGSGRQLPDQPRRHLPDRRRSRRQLPALRASPAARRGPSDGTGIRLPQDQNGQSPASFQPTGPFNTVFIQEPPTHPGTDAISISRGFRAESQFHGTAAGRGLRLRSDHLELFSTAKGIVFLDDGIQPRLGAVTPAIIDIIQRAVTLKIQSASAIRRCRRTPPILGGFAIMPRGDYLRTYKTARPDHLRGARLGIPLSIGIGPRHLVLNYGDDLYVLPDRRYSGTASGAGDFLGESESRRHGDLNGKTSIRAFTSTASIRSELGPANSITVVPPPGIDGHTAIVTVFNSDGQIRCCSA